MDDLLIRRREMILDSMGPIPGELLFQGVSYSLSQTGGSITRTGDTFKLKSTGSASWNLSVRVYGNTSLFKNFSSVKGHTIRIDFEIDWLSHAEGGALSLALGLYDNISSAGSLTRRRYSDIPINSVLPGATSGVSGRGTCYFVVPTALSGWESGSGGSDSSYLDYAIYLYSNAGSEVNVTLTFYDCGIL